MATLNLSPVEVLTWAVSKALAPAPLPPLPLDHPTSQCEYCDSKWVVELRRSLGDSLGESVHVCLDCADSLACEYCGERVAVVHFRDTEDPETGYSDGETHLCAHCARQLRRPAIANVLPSGNGCKCGTDDVFGCKCGTAEVRL